MRRYTEVDLTFGTTEIESLTKSINSDRQYINKIMEKTFSKYEMNKSSAKGQQSHGKTHEPLDPGRLAFVQRKFLKASKREVLDLKMCCVFFFFNYLPGIFATRVNFNSSRMKIFLSTVNKKCNNVRKTYCWFYASNQPPTNISVENWCQVALLAAHLQRYSFISHKLLHFHNYFSIASPIHQ